MSSFLYYAVLIFTFLPEKAIPSLRILSTPSLRISVRIDNMNDLYKILQRISVFASYVLNLFINLYQNTVSRNVILQRDITMHNDKLYFITRKVLLHNRSQRCFVAWSLHYECNNFLLIHARYFYLPF